MAVAAEMGLEIFFLLVVVHSSRADLVCFVSEFVEGEGYLKIRN